jgi:hypothetical protein
MAESRFETVYSSLHAWEVILLQQALEQEGIESFVDNDNLVGADWLLSNALGGVRLRVYAEDAERAVQAIERLQENEPLVDEEQSEADERPRCPKCGSDDVGPAPWPMVALVASYFLLGVPFLFRNRLKCRECGETWRR